MRNSVSVIKLLSSVADGVVSTVSANLPNNIQLTADPTRVVFQGNLRDIIAFLDKDPDYTTPVFSRSVRRAANPYYKKSGVENPHPTHMVNVIQGTTFRLDVDYIIPDKDVSRFSLITKSDLCKLSGISYPYQWEHYLRNIPRFTLLGKPQIYYHPMHVYHEFGKYVDHSNHVKKIIDKLRELAYSSPNSMPVPEWMSWCHSAKNPWLVNFRALGSCINLAGRELALGAFNKVYEDISTEYRGLIDVRDVLKRLMEFKDTRPDLMALHAHQRNTLRRCILEIDDYAKRRKISTNYNRNNIDMNFEMIGGKMA